MASYRAPLRDMSFVLRELAGVDDIAQLPGFEEAAGVLEPVLAEAAIFAAEVLDPLNAIGDRAGCTLQDGEVTTPPGFKAAYRQFAQAGWIGMPVSTAYGGQGLPLVLLGAVLEMWNGANVGFANGPLLNAGAIEALELVGSEEQKQAFIPRLISGEWMGTMCLTEPQAGSDLAAVRTRAVPAGDHYEISGQKIFITFGEHDLTPNIIHLVLARLPDAPEGTKGISMFIVPKVLVNADGSLGERNDVFCAGIEHKLGLNANPTCTLNYGEKSRGAIGYLVGEANRGLEYMFIMMNFARWATGVQGLGIADRAYQSALTYARERIQGRDLAARSTEPVAIVRHPDVRRMLMSMKAQIEAMRALAYATAAALDTAHRSPDDAVRRRERAFAEFMIPIVKGWCTETATELCSTALQVFGGMGFIEEAGIAQQYRDVRISPIYEGTTGIQALDLVGRKLIRDMGTTATKIVKTIAAFVQTLDSADPDVAAIKDELEKAVTALGDTSSRIGMNAMSDLNAAFACSVPYLKLWGIVAGGWQMARAAQISAAHLAAGDAEAEFYRAKLTTARFYADHVLSQAAWLHHQIVNGSAAVMRLSDDGYDLDRRTLAQR
ncbi:MAG: acyl-CoA dehydrogenase [Candidatus Lustribacter sp.]|jgi:acyl-CoA dehydrogenase